MIASRPRRAALAAVAVTAALAAPVAARAATAQAGVFLLQGEKLKPVQRAVAQRTVALAVGALLGGPTAAERKAGIATQVPAAAKLLGVRIASGTANVDLTFAYIEGTSRASLLARLAQLVWTATDVPGVRGMRLWIDGKPASSMGQGVSVDHVLNRDNLDPPDPAELPPTTSEPDGTGSTVVDGTSTRSIQSRLASLGYLPAAAVTGHLGPWTRAAVMAFQGVARIGRDGIPGPVTVGKLKTAKRPTPAAGSGKRLEVHLDSQVVYLVDGAKVLRIVKVSTGMAGFATPKGSYKILRKHLKDWSYPYSVWLPYASYFNGGIAFHESPDVPAYAASHGCVRVPQDEAKALYEFAVVGRGVRVLA